MPAYGKNLSPAETTALVAFLQTLHPAGQAPARDASRAVAFGGSGRIVPRCVLESPMTLQSNPRSNHVHLRPSYVSLFLAAWVYLEVVASTELRFQT